MAEEIQSFESRSSETGANTGSFGFKFKWWWIIIFLLIIGFSVLIVF